MIQRPSSALRAQRGVSILTAIFLLLLFGLLAALMARVISASHATAAEDLIGARSYQAARGGVEWGLYQVLDPSDATATAPSAPLPACFANGTALSGLGATVTVDCTAYGPYTEGSKAIRIYRIAATATNPGPGGLSVERRVEVTTEKCRDGASSTAPYAC